MNYEKKDSICGFSDLSQPIAGGLHINKYSIEYNFRFAENGVINVLSLSETEDGYKYLSKDGIFIFTENIQEALAGFSYTLNPDGQDYESTLKYVIKYLKENQKNSRIIHNKMVSGQFLHERH